jgi:hypothetical protein
MLKKSIRKKLIEVKESKKKNLTEQKIVHNRIMTIFESEYNIKNFNSLPKSKKRKYANALSRELFFINENKLLSEQSEGGGITGLLKGIFGNAFYGVIETMLEPLVDSILGGLGLKGFFKQFLVSAFTNEKILKSWGDCRVMTEVVADGIVEAIVMKTQETLGTEGIGYSFIRNAMIRVFRDQSFYKDISDSIEEYVCSIFDKISGNVEKVADKLQPEASTQKVDDDKP